MMSAPGMASWPEGGPRITQADAERISRLVYTNSGIALRPDVKQTMIVARLQKRLRQGRFASFADYLQFVERDRSGAELKHLLDALTTNHTAFQREPEHFTFLAQHVVPALAGRRADEPISGWSCACATGEEAYSLAVTLLDAISTPQHGRIKLLASDLSTKAIDTARQGVYPIERVTGLPADVLRRYFERGVGEQTGLARVKRSVRDLIEFRRLNLVELDDLGVTFQFIFCRNAMIYFDRASRQHVVSMLARHLVPRGFLFLSQCESLGEISHSLTWRAAGVYQRGDA
jgi:chemotaxis protein methyltransferase CheR